MQKILLFSHSGFSDENANGLTMKNLLSAWSAEEKAEMYCDVQPPDYSAAHRYFRLTDMQVIKAFCGKKDRYVLDRDDDMQCSKQANVEKKVRSTAQEIPAWLRKHHYNFVLKWIREYMRILGPWWQSELQKWIEEIDPDVLVYMVGESIFLDKIVLKTVQKTGKPLVLYNGEAFRIIDISLRKGIERAYYRKVESLYEKLDRAASLVIYNSEMLKKNYQEKYDHHADSIVAYNSADIQLSSYNPTGKKNITYFGNLGVGRSESLLQLSEVLAQIDPTLRLDIYGNATAENARKLGNKENIHYHGFVNAEQLRKVIEESDILLHVESFDPEIVPKLKYAFSTKIAQCLCAGRCFVSYAPKGAASSAYLESQGFPVAGDEATLRKQLNQMINDENARRTCAAKAEAIGRRNHQQCRTARIVREAVDKLIQSEGSNNES